MTAQKRTARPKRRKPDCEVTVNCDEEQKLPRLLPPYSYSVICAEKRTLFQDVVLYHYPYVEGKQFFLVTRVLSFGVIRKRLFRFDTKEEAEEYLLQSMKLKNICWFRDFAVMGGC